MSNKSDDILKKYFNTIKEENYKSTFLSVENWLKSESAHSYVKQEKTKFNFLKYIFSEGRLKYAYLFIILILAGVASNFSVTRTETVGNVMSWSVDKQKPDVIKKIDNLDWIDKSQLIVDQQNCDGKEVLTYKILLNTSNNIEIEKLKNELSNIKDIQSINVIPISEPIKQPLYAVALDKVFNVGYTKNYANPEEIKNNVYDQLKLAGIQNYVMLNSSNGNGSAGKFMSVNFGMQPDSVRIKVHKDIVNEFDLDKALDEVDELFAPISLVNDSVLQKIVVKINGEELTTQVILNEVYRNLDTLHIKLRNNGNRRREKMEKFNEKMEKFNERMERFNRSMEKFNKKMEKFNDKMKNLNVPNSDYHFEINENGDIDIDIDTDIDVDLDEIPEIEENNFKFNFNADEFNKSFKINIDTLNFRLDMEKMNKEIKENAKKMKEDMKKLKGNLKKHKYNIDTSKIKIFYNDDDDIDIDEDEDIIIPDIKIEIDKNDD
jgi:hypothetical protein